MGIYTLLCFTSKSSFLEVEFEKDSFCSKEGTRTFVHAGD